MNKEEQKKPREVELNIELHKNTPIIIQGTPIHIEGKDYTFNNIAIQLSPEFNMFLDGNNNIFTRKLYIKRENVSKNKKIITETYFEGNKIPQNEMQLFNDYDHIFAMDTNYKDYNGKKNCIGMIGQLYKDSTNGQIALKKLANIKFELDSSCKYNPEKYTWCKFIEFLCSSEIKNSRIALIVDSELDCLQNYNNGEPILNNHKLPKNMKFVYASADKRDTFLNWAIRQCDSAAKKALEH